jgi:3,4-dihydroxy 2-butanone 4-phosphate synthase / GTP cyclohydrolase II
MPRVTVEQAIEDFRAGRFVVIFDDESRENEGDLAIAAQWCTPEAVNFMARFGRGLICVPMTGERLDHLGIPMMVPPDQNGTRHGTAFTVSVEARQGVTTGISAADRATTIRALIDPASGPADLSMPGHIFPLRAREGGVLARAGQTEASVDLARLAGLLPAAVICEIMNDDGTMARMDDLERFAATHGLSLLCIADLIAYRRQHEQIVRRETEVRLPTDHGDFRLAAYSNAMNGDINLALVMGDVTTPEPVLVRLHSECLTGDVLGSQRCDCGRQLDTALGAIASEGRGVLVYLRQEGRGIGLLNKLRAYGLQDKGLDTVQANLHLGFPADPRDYTIAGQILRDLGIQQVRLLTNNPRKRSGLEDLGLTVVERVPIVIPPNVANRHYLATKRDKLGHLLGAIAGGD